MNFMNFMKTQEGIEGAVREYKRPVKVKKEGF